jgi:broad specificity phosphatase PhoE
VGDETVISTIRHAETTWGPLKRYAGSIDVPLSEQGVEDCRNAAKALAGMGFDVVITSHLKRSIDSALLLVSDRVRFVRTPLCAERRFGVMEGLTWQDVQDLDPPILFIEVGGDRHSVNPKGGEPFEDVWQRAKRFRAFVFRQFRGSNVLVVSHGVFLQMFHGVLRGSTCIESLATYPANLELASFSFSGKHLIDENVMKLSALTEADF